jgi:hypothetical protein
MEQKIQQLSADEKEWIETQLQGDVLIDPANFVAKRWERRETDFLQKSYADIAGQVNKLRGGGGQVFN